MCIAPVTAQVIIALFLNFLAMKNNSLFLFQISDERDEAESEHHKHDASLPYESRIHDLPPWFLDVISLAISCPAATMTTMKISVWKNKDQNIMQLLYYQT